MDSLKVEFLNKETDSNITNEDIQKKVENIYVSFLDIAGRDYSKTELLNDKYIIICNDLLDNSDSRFEYWKQVYNSNELSPSADNETDNTSSSEKIIIPYILSDKLIIKPEKELAIWVNVWLESKFRILILSIALLILSLITIFQEKISKYRKIFRYLRISYLSFTLIWIGWYTGAQLSIFNILSLVRIPITGADLNYFLIDPLLHVFPDPMKS